MNSLSHSETDYYSRQLMLPEWGNHAQLKLKKAKVMVVGAGALGCSVLQSLSRAGVGHIGIIDEDVIVTSNLQRQILFDINDIGKNKAVCSSEKIKYINPNIELKTFIHRINEDNALELIKNYDVVVDGTDNFETKYLLNDACVMLGKPMVYGAIDTYEGQVSVFNTSDESPTYRCLFPQPPKHEERNNCATIGVSPFLPQIIGGLQATEVIKLITGIGENISGKLIIYHSLNTQFSVFQFCLNPDNKNPEKTDLKNKETSGTAIEGVTYEIMQNENLILIDVRDETEHEKYNLGGMNIPLYDLEEYLYKFEKADKICTYCETSSKAKQAAIILSNTLGKRVYYLTTPLNALRNSLK